MEDIEKLLLIKKKPNRKGAKMYIVKTFGKRDSKL
jgi:hypothetical protein